MIILEKIYKWILKAIYLALTILGAALVLLVFYSVLSRYIFNFSIAWADEASRFMFIWMLMLGVVLISDGWSHMAVSFVVEKMPQKLAGIFRILAVIISIAALLILVRGGYNIVLSNWDWTSSALRISYGKVYAVLPITCAVMIIQAIIQIARIIKSDFLKQKEAE